MGLKPKARAFDDTQAFPYYGYVEGGLGGLTPSISMPEIAAGNTHKMLDPIISSWGEDILQCNDLAHLFGRRPFPTSTFNVVLRVYQCLCRDLNKDVSNFMAHNEVLVATNTELITVNNELAVANEELEDANEKVSSELSTLQNKFWSVSAEHSDERCQRKILQEDVAQANDKVSHLTRKLEEAEKFSKAMIEGNINNPILRDADHAFRNYGDSVEDAIADAMFDAYCRLSSPWSKIARKFYERVKDSLEYSPPCTPEIPAFIEEAPRSVSYIPILNQSPSEFTFRSMLCLPSSFKKSERLARKSLLQWNPPLLPLLLGLLPKSPNPIKSRPLLRLRWLVPIRSSVSARSLVEYRQSQCHLPRLMVRTRRTRHQPLRPRRSL